MDITLLSASGIHHREVPGIDALKRLPAHWYGYANLEAVQAGVAPKEIDVVIVLDDRIVIADIKDWHGTITTDGRKWYQNKQEKGPSPVAKISGNVRLLATMLEGYTKRFSVDARIPWIDSCVIMTGKAKFDSLPDRELSRTFHIDDFCAMIVDKKRRDSVLTKVPSVNPNRALTGKGNFWKFHFNKFFGPGEYFKPRERVFGAYRVVSDVVYNHGDLYAEYDAQEMGAANASGLFRHWDFSKSDTKFSCPEGRAEVAGREQKVLNFLLERSQDMENALLRQKVADTERGILFWEIFERRRQTQRLSRFLHGDGKGIANSVRIDLVRTLLTHAARLHALGVAHCDIGDHSVWLELPSTVRFSHLFAARIPEGKTIAADRYKFLARPVQFPETFIEQASSLYAKDVFLLGCVAHQLLLGAKPEAARGEPVEWNPAADAHGSFKTLHSWLAQALETEVERRFPDATAMLDAFNAATRSMSADAYTLEHLHRFSTYPSVFQLWSAYPPAGPSIEDNSRIMIYSTVKDGRPLIVKMWKRSNCWVDEKTDGARLLAFCQRAQDIADRPLDGVCPIREVVYLSDHIAVVQDRVDAPSLQSLLDSGLGVGPFLEPQAILNFLQSLIDTVNALHGQGLAHGDLTPANILCVSAAVSGTADDAALSDVKPLLIDIVDLPGTDEGERFTPEYAPVEPCGAAERDRCAVLLIAERMLVWYDLNDADIRLMGEAIGACRFQRPVFSTLAPFADALRTLRQPAEDRLLLRIAMPPGTPDGFVLRPDAGEYHVGVWRHGYETAVLVTGANARLFIELNRKNKPWRVRLQEMSQDEIGLAQRKRCHGLKADIHLERDAPFDPDSAQPLLDLPEVAALLDKVEPTRSTSTEAETEIETPPDAEVVSDTDIDLDAEAEAGGPAGTPSPLPVAADAPSADAAAPASSGEPVEAAPIVDVAALWRTLMDVELEDIVEAVADEDAEYAPAKRRNLVRCHMRRGSLEFDADDRVSVKILNRRDQWVFVGHMDIGATRAGLVVIDASRYHYEGSPLCSAGSLLRFESRMAMESRNRRERAIAKILGRESLIRNLVDHFSSLDTPMFPMRGTTIPDAAHLESRYRLNSSQIQAFQMLWTTGPVGLLQGPPGTGKTTFIAAFMHHALTQGGVNSILLASQSHEAVDNAAKGVIKLFRDTGETLSLVRVGQKGDLPDMVRPFHKESVEQRYRDEFRARFKDKIMVAGRRLGLSDAFLEGFHFLVTTIRPILKKLRGLVEAPALKRRATDEKAERRAEHRAELEETVFRLLANIGITQDDVNALGLAALGIAYGDGGDSDDGHDVIIDTLGDRDASPEDAEPYSLAPFHLGVANAFEIVTKAYAQDHDGVTPDQIRRLLAVVELMDDWLGHVGSRRRNFEEFLVNTRQIVCGTCVGLGNTSLGIANTKFDLVIIDEAARCTASELAVPMQAGLRVILVGDHKQLPPFHAAAYVAQAAQRTGLRSDEVRRSDFERAFLSPYGRNVGRTLRVQYRMLEPIGRLVSETFYRDSPLEHGRSEPKIPEEAWPPALSKALVWLDTAKAGKKAHETERKKSRQNTAEERAIIALLRALDKHEPFHGWLRANQEAEKPLEHPIGIVCTYMAQATLINRSIHAAGISPALRAAIKVDTVDSYQGKENLMVILSLVRNNNDGPMSGKTATIKQGFLSQPHRINVALSRAMDRLVIVGTTKGWPPGSPMASVVNKAADLSAEGLAAFIDAVER